MRFMRFIKTYAGNILNVDKVITFFICEIDDIYKVFAATHEDQYCLFGSKNEEEAENYLQNIYLEIR